jgi:hypothetical protein
MTAEQRPLRFHLSLNVPRDRFEATVQFYATLFGGPPAKRKTDYAKFEPAEPYVNLAMNAVPQAPLGELDHLGIQVFSDEALSAARARVTAAGLSVRDEHEVECCYAGQNKFWVTDPNGRQVEFFHVLRDVERHGKTVSLRTLPVQSSGACCGPGEDCG